MRRRGTLRTILRRGPLSIRRLLDIGIQIAAGLAAAHGSGITHRDLKPENVMVTTDGRVKLLDFGLAKLSSTQPVNVGHDDLTLPRISLTEEGTVMGTADYMSPEQARGTAVDYRSDQFSFGLILYEPASGRQAFHRDSRAETMAAIIREAAGPLESSVPAPIRWIVERLLAKGPQDRYASTEDLYRDLRALRERLSEVSTASTAAPNGNRIVLVGNADVGQKSRIWLMNAAGGSPAPLDRADNVDLPGWSPDGQWIAYVRQEGARTQLVKLRVQVGAAPIPLSESSRAFTTQARTDWSPKGDWILFVSVKPGLTLISPDGKSQRSLSARTPVVYGFSKDGARVYAVIHNTAASLPEWQLLSIDVASGTEKVLRTVDLPPQVSSIGDFSMHPDGKRFLFSAGTFNFDIWMLEGFEQRTSLLDRFLRR